MPAAWSRTGSHSLIHHEYLQLLSTVATFLLLGHETSAVALSWLLHELSLHQSMQERLREEIKAAYEVAALEGREDLTYDEVDNLGYLDAIIVGGVSICLYARSSL